MNTNYKKSISFSLKKVKNFKIDYFFKNLSTNPNNELTSKVYFKLKTFSLHKSL